MKKLLSVILCLVLVMSLAAHQGFAAMGGAPAGEVTIPEGTETTGPEGGETPGLEGTETTTPAGGETPGLEGTETTTPAGGETPGLEGTETTTPAGGETPGLEGTETTTPAGGETPGLEGTETTTPEGGETPGLEGTETTGLEGTETTGPEGGETPGPEGTETTGPEGTETTGLEGTETTTPEGGDSAVPAPSINITLNKSTVAVGESITASWDVANAPEGSYTNASWIVFDTNVSSGEQNDVRKTSATFTPQYGISGFVSVSLMDANDELIMSQDSSSFTITGADPVSPYPVLPAEATIQLSLNKESVAVGDSITANYQLVGAPEGWTLVAFWSIVDTDGKHHTIKIDTAQTSSSITVKFGATGNLTLEPSHPDANPASDRSVSRDFTITGGTEAPELSLSLSKSTGSVAVGSPISFSWQAQGGTAPYTYEYAWGLNEGQEYLGGDRIENSTETSFSLTPQGGTTGYFSVDVTDAVGRTVHESYMFEVVKGEVPPAPSINITLNKSTVAVGESITASWEVANAPEGSYTNASWIVFDTNVSSGEQNDVRKTSATFTPQYGISGFVSVSLMDANDELIMSQDSSSFTITGADPVSPYPVLPAEATIQLSLNKESVAVGDSITANYQLVGAPEGWTLVAFWNIIDTDGKYHTVKTDFAQTSSSITVKFGATGDLTLVPSHPDATPASDRSVSRDFTITGGVETPELTLSLSKSTGSVAVGSPISFSWQAQGGTAPYTYEYAWSLYEGQEYLGGDWIENSTETSFSLTPQGGTTGYFSVDVTDAVGRTVHESYMFEVVKGEVPPAPSITLTLSKSSVAVGEPITAAIQANEAPEGWYASFYWELVRTKYYEPFLSENRKTSSTIYPSFGVRGCVQYTVYDAQGKVIASGASDDFTITGSAPIPEEPSLPADAHIEVTLDKDTVAVGETLNASYRLVGAPEGWDLNAVWLFEENGIQHYAGSYEHSTSSSFTPKAGTKGTLRVMPTHPDLTALGHQMVQKTFVITGASQAPKLQITMTSIATSVEIGSPNVATWTVEGGRAPYTFSYNWEAMDRDGQHQETGLITTDALTCSYIPTMGVSGSLIVTATDADGRQSTVIREFEITKPAQTPETQEPVLPEGAYVEVSLDRTSVAVGETITATYRLVNAPEEWTVAAGWEVTEESGETYIVDFVQHQNKSTFTPRFGVKGRLIIEPQHPKAQEPYHAGTVYRNFTITGGVEAPALSLNLEASAEKATIGSPISFRWQAQGGTAPYTYSYGWHIDDGLGSWYGEQIEITEINGTQIIPVPRSGNAGHFWAKVVDADGRNTMKSIDFEVVKPATVVVPPVEEPVDRPVQRPVAKPTQTQAPKLEALAKSVVVDEQSNDLPFAISTTQDTAGQKTLVIAATQPKESLESQQTMKWILSPALVQAASQQGHGQISAQREDISVLLNVDALLKGGSRETLVSIQSVETKTLPDEVQKQVKAQALSKVYQISVSTALPDELVHVRFVADDRVKNAAVMVIRADGSLVLYPDVTITVDAQGNRSVDVMVENGAMCYLINR